MALIPGRRGRQRSERARVAGQAAATVASQAPAAAAPDPKAAAFFDVDNTMMVGASIFHFARGLASRGFFTSKDLVKMAVAQVVFRVVGQESQDGMSRARENALAFVAGMQVSEINRLGDEIFDELMADKIWPGTRALAQQHLDAGQRVWLITATPMELAVILARKLGLTGAMGTVAEVDANGIYTGRLAGEPLHGQAKAEAVRALAEQQGLDLARCSAYSDSVNDVPMLSVVGHPMAINPDPDLRAHAREHGWPVRDFRTARTVARIGIPAAAGTGAVAGTVAAAVVLARRRAALRARERSRLRRVATRAGRVPAADRLRLLPGRLVAS